MKTENVAESRQTDIPCRFLAGHETECHPSFYISLSIYSVYSTFYDICTCLQLPQTSTLIFTVARHVELLHVAKQPLYWCT